MPCKAMVQLAVIWSHSMVEHTIKKGQATMSGLPLRLSLLVRLCFELRLRFLFGLSLRTLLRLR